MTIIWARILEDRKRERAFIVDKAIPGFWQEKLVRIKMLYERFQNALITFDLIAKFRITDRTSGWQIPSRDTC